MDEFDICGCGSCADCCPPYGGEGLCGWSGSKDDDDDDDKEGEVSGLKNNQEVSMWEFDFEIETAAYVAWHRRKLERKLERLERTIRDEYEQGADKADPVLMRRALEIRAQLG